MSDNKEQSNYSILRARAAPKDIRVEPLLTNRGSEENKEQVTEPNVIEDVQFRFNSGLISLEEADLIMKGLDTKAMPSRLKI